MNAPLATDLPILGFWGLARRLVHVRNQATREAALGIHRMTTPMSDKWFATAERLRQEDERRYFAALAGRARRSGDE